MPAPTVTFAVALLPRESVSETTSTTPGVGPAVYAPAPVMLPPEALVCRAHA